MQTGFTYILTLSFYYELAILLTLDNSLFLNINVCIVHETEKFVSCSSNDLVKCLLLRIGKCLITVSYVITRAPWDWKISLSYADVEVTQCSREKKDWYSLTSHISGLHLAKLRWSCGGAHFLVALNAWGRVFER